MPTMTVAQNLFLGQEKFLQPPARHLHRRAAVPAVAEFRRRPDRDWSARSARPRSRWSRSRARCCTSAKVIIFDEPTATLTPEEKKYFFDLVRDLKKRGVSIIFISHALEEALLLADRITVLRDGKHVVTDDAANFDRARIVQAMVGRDLSQHALRRSARRSVRPAGRARADGAEPVDGADGEEQLALGLRRADHRRVRPGRRRPHRDLQDRRRRAEARLLPRRRDPAATTSRCATACRAPAVRDGIAYVTEDRKVEGFFETMSIARQHLSRPAGEVSGKGRDAAVEARDATRSAASWIERLNVRAIGDDGEVVELSGGNQQKVVIAKSLVQEPELIIFDEPTRGVDVGAIVEIHELINRLADEGKAVVVISSYLPEIMALSDRILVCTRRARSSRSSPRWRRRRRRSCTRRSTSDCCLRLLPLLSQRLDEAQLQFIGRLLADVLADLRARLRQRIRLFQKLLDRPAEYRRLRSGAVRRR